MPTLYDDTGEALEGALAPDEAKALQDKFDTASKDLEDTKTRLAGLESKDMNFRRLEQMTETEKGKLSDKEKELMQRQEALEDQQKSFENKQTESYREYAFRTIVGTDKDLREAVEEKYKIIAGDAKTPEEIAERVQDALAMARRKHESINPIASIMGAGGTGPVRKDTNFADTARGKDLAAALGMNISKTDKK